MPTAICADPRAGTDLLSDSQQGGGLSVKPAFYFLLLRKVPSSWGKFPSWGNFLHREVGQMPEQGGDRHTELHLHTTSEGAPRCWEDLSPVKDISPDIPCHVPRPVFLPCPSSGVTPPCTSSSAVLILYWANSGPQHSGNHSPCCQENVLLPQQIELAQHNIRWAPGRGEVRQRKEPFDPAGLSLHSNSCYC